MKSFTLSLFAAASRALTLTDGYDNEYTHTHIDYGEAHFSKDIEVLYEELEYDIVYDHKQEVRSRQREVPYIHKETEIKYQAITEERYTTQYETKYKHDTITKYEYKPRVEYGSYIYT